MAPPSHPTDQPGRTVLIITYKFPPSGGSGVQRVLKMVRYLGRFGWSPVVLCPRLVSHSQDPALLAEVPPDVPVYRVPELGERLPVWQRRTPPHQAPTATQPESGADRRPLRLVRLIRRLILEVALIPDGSVLWSRSPLVGAVAARLVARHRLEAVYATSPYHGVQLLGAELARRCALPYVMDLRDPWAQATITRRNPFHHYINRHMEARCLRRADRILLTTRRHLQTYQEAYPGVDRFEVLPNGWDPADLEGLPPPRPTPDVFTMAHVGTLTKFRGTETLMRATGQLAGRNEAFRQAARLVFAGRVEQDVIRMAEAMELAQPVECPGYLSHPEAIHLMRSSQLLLLIQGQNPALSAYIPGKTYEYLASQRPILVQADRKSAIAEALEGVPGVYWPAERSEEALLQALEQAFRAWQEGRSASMAPERAAVAARFRRDRQAGRLAGILDAITGG